jgi:hypothetical protein
MRRSERCAMLVSLRPMLKARDIYRSGFEDLSSRVRQLEDAVFIAQESAPSRGYATMKFTEISGTTSSNGQGESPVLANKASAARAYRGDTSPWVSLVNHVDSKADLDHQFQETATRLAEDERSSNFSTTAISYDLLQVFPHLQRSDVLHHITLYAMDAPYPILHYDSLIEATEQLLDTRRLARWGQIACILMVWISYTILYNRLRRPLESTFVGLDPSSSTSQRPPPSILADISST